MPEIGRPIREGPLYQNLLYESGGGFFGTTGSTGRLAYAY